MCDTYICFARPLPPRWCSDQQLCLVNQSHRVATGGLGVCSIHRAQQLRLRVRRQVHTVKCASAVTRV